GAHVSSKGAIRDAYQKSGFEKGPLGFPKSGEYAVGKTRVQDFQGGKIVLESNGKTAIRYK
ncbi:SpoIID/LytB domain protein, partial [Arthrobacter sp. YD2]|nr:SpoIID/LytB domain protein [Arthrobacter sp. YD2]